MMWQDIATAPRDGTGFLAYWLRKHTDGTRYEAICPFAVAYYHGDILLPDWLFHDDLPTHWMPLPTPPQPPETEA
jgi:hypothetical protein